MEKISIKILRGLGFTDWYADYGVTIITRPEKYNEQILYRINHGCKGVSYSVGGNIVGDIHKKFKTLTEIKEFWLTEYKVKL